MFSVVLKLILFLFLPTWSAGHLTFYLPQSEVQTLLGMYTQLFIKETEQAHEAF